MVGRRGCRSPLTADLRDAHRRFTAVWRRRDL